jgi:hypothetical protein
MIGILATGFIAAIGGDNYWGLSNFGSLDASVPSAKAQVLMFTLAAVAALFDLIALGVIFAGGVVVIQRLRGRM